MSAFFESIKEIYSKLMDEKSKDIFANRLLYSLSGDKKYIDKIVTKYITPSGLNSQGAVKYLLAGVEQMETDSLVVYGCGEMGAKIYAILGERIAFFCDSDQEKQKNGFCGKRVISLKELESNKERYQVIIGSIDYYIDIYETLQKLEIRLAVDNRKIVLKWLEMVNQQYFERDIISYGEKEVFVDGGCLNYASSKQFLKECTSKYKKVYAFEPDPESAKRCRTEAEKIQSHQYKIIEKGLYSAEMDLHFAVMGNGCSSISEAGDGIVHVCSIDQEISEPITFIKMDIEGAELEALKGATKTIKRDHPKLAICVYHKKEDIVDIPKYILDIDPSYKLYMRHYSDNAGETVLYAI